MNTERIAMLEQWGGYLVAEKIDDFIIYNEQLQLQIQKRDKMIKELKEKYEFINLLLGYKFAGPIGNYKFCKKCDDFVLYFYLPPYPYSHVCKITEQIHEYDDGHSFIYD
jgi:hypothetical protein